MWQGEKIQLKDFSHETKKSLLKRFLIVAGIFVVYLIFVLFKFGWKNGILVALLSWSFFVLCTPICDAGLLFDLPVRLLTKIRMIYAEILTWIFAITLNILTISLAPAIYAKTSLLKLFKTILIHPYPYWAIIILSAVGTFLSVYFGDELLDIAFFHQQEKYPRHKNKLYLVILLFLVVVIIFLYEHLLKELGIKI